MATVFLSILLYILNILPCGLTGRTWETLYLDKDCSRYIRNDNLDESDIYSVKSDSWHGQFGGIRRPAECSSNFNFGDRLITVKLVEAWCDELYPDPFLAVYDNCEGLRVSPLVVYNCSTKTPEEVHSATACVSLYHYRGHTKSGFFFALDVVAGTAGVTFPAGGIAAIFMAIIIGSLVVAKIVCLVTGYERKVPSHILQCIEEQKHVLPFDMHSDQPLEVAPVPSPVMQRVPTRDNSPNHRSRRESGRGSRNQSLEQLTSNRHSSPGFVFQNAASTVDGDILSSRSCEDLDYPPHPGTSRFSESPSVSFFLGDESKHRSLVEDAWQRKISVTPERRIHSGVTPERHVYSTTPPERRVFGTGERLAGNTSLDRHSVHSSATPERRFHSPERLVHSSIAADRQMAHGLIPEQQRHNAANRRQHFTSSSSKINKNVRSCEV